MRRKFYFEREEGAPPPFVREHSRRARFGEVDAMAIVWHGHYAVIFEEVSTELRRDLGLTYEAFFEEGLRAPIVKLHVDYHRSLVLDELFTARASLVWSSAARLNIEYEIRRGDGEVAATGYTVQLFTTADGEPCFLVPPLLERCLRNWKEGGLA